MICFVSINVGKKFTLKYTSNIEKSSINMIHKAYYDAGMTKKSEPCITEIIVNSKMFINSKQKMYCYVVQRSDIFAIISNGHVKSLIMLFSSDYCCRQCNKNFRPVQNRLKVLLKIMLHVHHPVLNCQMNILHQSYTSCHLKIFSFSNFVPKIHGASCYLFRL